MSTTKTNTSDEKKAETKNASPTKNDKRANPRGSKSEKSSEKVEKAANESSDKQPAPRPTMSIDDTQVQASYANLCRVSSTPEELILDLGLNPNPYAKTDTTVQLSQRIIMNHYTAKRLLAALSVTLQRHEQAFGVLEVDVNRRVKSK